MVCTAFEIISAMICCIVAFANIATVHGSPSTLKVAVCNPGQLPYANVDKDGNLEGFDIYALNHGKNTRFHVIKRCDLDIVLFRAD